MEICIPFAFNFADLFLFHFQSPITFLYYIKYYAKCLVFCPSFKVYLTLNDTDFNRILTHSVESCRHNLCHPYVKATTKNSSKLYH